LRTEFNESFGHFSTDGRWIAYESNESGKFEIYVRPFDSSNPASQAGGQSQVSKDGGNHVRWRADGKELFYLAPDGSVMAVEVSGAGAAFQSGTPQRLFKSVPGLTSWDVAADGKRFLIPAPPATGTPAAAAHPYQVVLNWTEMLKR
jgi:Tol biopolymer transport system component